MSNPSPFQIDEIQMMRRAMHQMQTGETTAQDLLKNRDFKVALRLSLQLLLVTCHNAAQTAGWWQDPKTGANVNDNPLCFSKNLMLIVSEVSKAMEGDRKSLQDDKLPQYPMRTVELGDALIRILDTAGGFDLDLADAFVDKLIFNAIRPDHKKEQRVAEGGKAY